MCSPGGQIVPRPRRSILHHARPPQLPYNAKIVFFVVFGIIGQFPYILPICPLKGPQDCLKQLYKNTINRFTDLFYEEAPLLSPPAVKDTNTNEKIKGIELVIAKTIVFIRLEALAHARFFFLQGISMFVVFNARRIEMLIVQAIIFIRFGKWCLRPRNAPRNHQTL